MYNVICKIWNLQIETLNKFAIIYGAIFMYEIQEKSTKPRPDKSFCCAFTGHRIIDITPDTCKKKANYKRIYKKLNNLICEAIANGYIYFLCGMAKGIDMLCAEIVLKFMDKNPSISLECAIPHREQFIDYNDIDLARYFDILEKAQNVTLISEKYSSNCMMKRNRYMINCSSRLIGVWNGNTSGGTFKTLKLAEKKAIDCKLIMI